MMIIHFLINDSTTKELQESIDEFKNYDEIIFFQKLSEIQDLIRSNSKIHLNFSILDADDDIIKFIYTLLSTNS